MMNSSQQPRLSSSVGLSPLQVVFHPPAYGSIVWTVAASVLAAGAVIIWPAMLAPYLFWSAVVAAAPFFPRRAHSLEWILRFYLSDCTDLGRNDDGGIDIGRWFSIQLFVLVVRSTFILVLPLVLLYARRRADVAALRRDVSADYLSRLKFLSIVWAVIGIAFSTLKMLALVGAASVLAHLEAESVLRLLVVWWVPKSIGLWHIAPLLGGAMFLLNVRLVDCVYAGFESTPQYEPSRHLVAGVSASARIASVVSLYSLVCLIMGISPLLNWVRLPNLGLDIFPSN